MLLLARAEERSGGGTYLQFEAFADVGGGTRLRSTALFRPRCEGRIYWWLPLHKFIFRGLNEAVRRQGAEAIHRSGKTHSRIDKNSFAGRSLAS